MIGGRSRQVKGRGRGLLASVLGLGSTRARVTPTLLGLGT
jgi:hypothetical protein